MAFSGFKPGAGPLLMSSSSSKPDGDHHHSDSGYDSLLLYSNAGSLSSSVSNSFLASSCSSSSSSESSNSSSLFSQPATPVKNAGMAAAFGRHNSPDPKHQYVADINAFYLASLRSPKTVDKFVLATTSSNFADFSLASPCKFGGAVNPDDYVRERDTISSKLLRSPAFKLQQPVSGGGGGGYSSVFSPQRSFASGQFDAEASRPFIKSFSSRFIKKPPPEPTTTEMVSPEPARRTTPTEEEFLELLIKNHHLPGNPEFLIGRRMGVERLDIVSELNKRSMKNVLDHILAYATKLDVVRMAGVSREWRDVVQQNKQVNGERVRYLRQRRQVYERAKENKHVCGQLPPSVQMRAHLDCGHQWRTLDSSSLTNIMQQVLDQKQQHRFKAPGRVDLSPCGPDRRLGSLDMNCLNVNGRVLQSAIVESSARPSKLHREASLHSLVFQDDLEPMEMDEAACYLKRSPLKSLNPSYLAKHLKLGGSPPKHPAGEPHFMHSTAKSPKKLDAIGSKKSKKNLKRL